MLSVKTPFNFHLFCLCSCSHSACSQINFNLILMILLEVLMASTVILSARSAEDCCCHRKVCECCELLIASIPTSGTSLFLLCMLLSFFQPETFQFFSILQSYSRPLVIKPAVFPTRLLKAYSVSIALSSYTYDAGFKGRIGWRRVRAGGLELGWMDGWMDGVGFCF